jgi:hypothetical protein
MSNKENLNILLACALASAKSSIDGSSCCFNLFCVHPMTSVWLIQTAYGIEFSCAESLFKHCCCSTCYINQVYQTALNKGIPNQTKGRPFNRIPLKQNCPKCTCEVCYALCCPSCYLAEQLDKHIGMPYCMGLCCVFPWTAMNIIRYQYRIAGDDFWEDCFPGMCCITWIPMSVPVMAIITATKGVLTLQQISTEPITGRYLA